MPGTSTKTTPPQHLAGAWRSVVRLREFVLPHRPAVAFALLMMAVGTGMAPWVTKAVVDGLRSMAGEFVRTPKKGSEEDARYRAKIKLPIAEAVLSLVSAASTVAALENSHWFAAPFAALFTFGYGYVAVLLTAEQLERRRFARRSLIPAEVASIDLTPAE